MIRITRLIELAVRVALVLLIGVHLVLVTFVIVEKRALSSARAHYDGEPVAAALFSRAFQLGGLPAELMPSGSGVAVRYASSQCGFSARDEEWKGLASLLKERGIPVVVLLPRAEFAFPQDALVPAEATQVAYLSADWIKRYPLALTPTLLIFDADRRVVWHREGTLGPGDTKSAIRAIDAAKMRP